MGTVVLSIVVVRGIVVSGVVFFGVVDGSVSGVVSADTGGASVPFGVLVT